MLAKIKCQRRGSCPCWVLLPFAGLFLAIFALLAIYFRFNRIQDFADGEGNTDLKVEQPYSWPQYLGPDRSGVSRETGLLKQWPADGPPVAWETRLGPGYSSLAVAKGRLVTMFREKGHEVVICRNADTGKPIWRRSWEASYQGQDNRFAQGPRSTPTIDDDRVYAVGATGHFVCLDLTIGDELWQHDLNSEYDAEQLLWGVSFSPLIVGDNVIANPGGSKGAVVAFDKRSGAEVWKSGDDKAGYSSPMFLRACGEDQIVIFEGERLVGMRATDGHELWSLPWKTDFKLNITVPLWVDDHLFVSTGYGSGCAKLKLVRDDKDGIDVETVFRNKELSNHFTNSVYHQGCIYGSDRDNGDLVCMDYTTGKVNWRKKKYDRCQFLVGDGHIILQTEGALYDGDEVNARLVLLEPTPEDYRPISSFAFSHQAKCWAAPALANGKLYVRDHEKLTCYDLREK